MGESSMPRRRNCAQRLHVEMLERRLLCVTVPPGFVVTEVSSAAAIADLVSLELAPDNKMYVVRQNGQVQVYSNYSTFHPTPQRTNFFQNAPLPSLDFQDERGLIGFTLDPDFASNRFVYVHYTTTAPAAHNRISRFTANAAGDLALAGTEQVLLDLDNLGALNHNGGALHFGPDGKLYVGVGDNNTAGAPSQRLDTFKGKILRINPTPGNVIPGDNPTSFDGIAGSPTGNFRAIWAVGLRNPFTFSFQPGTGRFFINDVGGNDDTSWEEIDDGAPGRNYGWPTTEGDFSQASFPNFTRPFYTYPHPPLTGPVTGFALVGGAFYNPATYTFPAEYAGQYFFQDYPVGWIKQINPASAAVSDFATGANFPNDLDVAPDGSLLYLTRGQGRVVRVQYTGSLAPYIVSPPASITVREGDPATFSVVAGGGQPLSYQWERKSAGAGSFSDISGATLPTYELSVVAPADQGAQFRVRVDNSQPGETLSTAATLTVTLNQPPVATIVTPALGAHFNAGTSISFSGSAVDPEDGALPASAFEWLIEFHHHPEGSPGAHTHPAMPLTPGVTSGSYNIPTVGHTEADVWYRVHLTVTDSDGAKHSVFRDVLPNTATLSFATVPPGLSIKLDDIPLSTPHAELSVVGVLRTVDAPASQSLGGVWYSFASWSDAGTRLHQFPSPVGDTTYTATYAVDPAPAVTASGFAFDGVLLPSPPHRVSFVFSEDISASLSPADLVVQNTTTGQAVPVANFAVAWNSLTNTATFTFPGYPSAILPNGRYIATLQAAGVTDPPGQPIAANEQVQFFVLAGDANRDMKVDSDDFNILATHFGTAGGFVWGDFTYNGIIDSDDFNILAVNFGANLASGALARIGIRRGARDSFFSPVRIAAGAHARPIDLLRDDTFDPLVR